MTWRRIRFLLLHFAPAAACFERAGTGKSVHCRLTFRQIRVNKIRSKWFFSPHDDQFKCMAKKWHIYWVHNDNKTCHDPWFWKHGFNSGVLYRCNRAQDFYVRSINDYMSSSTWLSLSLCLLSTTTIAEIDQNVDFSESCPERKIIIYRHHRGKWMTLALLAL